MSTIKHNFHSNVPDSPDVSLIQASHWNADHVFNPPVNGIPVDDGTGNFTGVSAASEGQFFRRAYNNATPKYEFTSPHFLRSDDFQFSATPTQALIAGTPITIDLSYLPNGVRNAFSPNNHYIRIIDAVSGNETCLITAVNDAASTISITPTLPHLIGNYTIASATVGLQEAINSLPSTGGTIFAPPGAHTLYGPVNKRAIPIFVRGAGMDATTFIVSTSFSLSHLGVFVIPDDLAVYNTAYLTSGGYSDFTIRFTQPDSNNLANYTKWPAAFYGAKTSRPSFEQITIIAGWDGIKILGYNGVKINNVNSSCFHHGLELDQHVDASHIYNFHSWVFGLTALQNEPFLYNPAVFSMYIGKADDTQIIGYGGIPSVKFTDGWSGTGALLGAPWVTMTNSDLDSGSIIMDAKLGGRVQVRTSQIGGAAGTDADGMHARAPLVYASSGELDISDCWIGFTDANLTAANVPIIDVDFSFRDVSSDQGTGHVTLRGNRIYTSGDHKVIYIHTTGTDTGTVAIHENRIVIPDAPSVLWNNPIIHAIGTVRVIATGNVLNDKFSAAGMFFFSDVDMGHVITDNIVSNWSISYPALTLASIYKNNSGVTNGIPWAAAVVASAGTIIPTGTYFHVSGTAAIATIAQTATAGNSQVQLNELNIVFDGAGNWIQGGNISSTGTALAGRMYRFLWDWNMTKWVVSN